MNAIDYFIIGLVLISCLLGLVRGFLREVISLVGWLLGLWLAWKFADKVEPYLGGALAHPAVRMWVARLIILMGVLLLAALVGVILSYFTRHSPFGMADRHWACCSGCCVAACWSASP